MLTFTTLYLPKVKGVLYLDYSAEKVQEIIYLSKKYFSLSATFIGLNLALAACSNSSSSLPIQIVAAPPTPSSLPQPTPAGLNPVDFETAEYNTDWSLNAIKASEAYARGFTGKEAIIGFVDFNFELGNPEVDWHPLSRGKNQKWIDIYEAFLGVTSPDSHHGQWVSTIAAAKKNNRATQGVAFDAQVLAIDFFSGVSIHTEISNGVKFFVSDPWGYVVNNGARVVNKSIGYDEEDIIESPPARDGNEHYTTTDAARVVELGGLLIAAAGNDGDPDPMLSNIDTVDLITQNNLLASGGFFLVAGSINKTGVISDFSDRAGVLKDYYLVAPGEEIAVSSIDFGGGFGVGDGTSFAAPHVVGAAALLFGQWPQLEAFEVADILLSTATDLGAPGVDNIYGHGLLNLDEATKPSGQTTVAVKDAVAPVSVGGSMMVMGPAFGDARPQNLNSVMILDQYDRDYFIDASSAVLAAPVGLDFDGILDMRRSQAGGVLQFNAGLRANLNIENNSLSPDTHQDFLSDLEKTTQQKKLRSWHLSGGLGKNSRWAIGQGRSLDSVLDVVDSRNITDQDLFLSGHRQNIAAGPDNMFMAGGMALDRRHTLSIGLMTGNSKGQGTHSRDVYQHDLPRYGVETRMTRLFDRGQMSISLGALLEEKTVLGSRSSAGFALADHTITGTLSVKGQTRLGMIFGTDWALSGQATGGLSDVTTNQVSLFRGFNRFTSSQWSASLATHDLFAKGDRIGLTVSQPLRVENARLMVTTATHFDLATDAPAFASQQVNLTPTGREIALEAGYYLRSGRWSVSANLINRFNAGHRASLNDIAVLLHAAKKF